MANLFVNVDHVATLRQARGTTYPDVGQAADICVQGGCQGITVHLREDRRHIQEKDVLDLKERLRVPLCLEMAPLSEMVDIALKYRPDRVTLVPEKREELTTEEGLNFNVYEEKVKKTIEDLLKTNIDICLFIEADYLSIEKAVELGVGTIELHTGHYASSEGVEEADEYCYRLLRSVEYAVSQGCEVHLGHGLDYMNISPLLSDNVTCFSIGHSIISRSVFVGLKKAVEEMLFLVQGKV